jgi:hypothetical protein
VRLRFSTASYPGSCGDRRRKCIKHSQLGTGGLFDFPLEVAHVERSGSSQDCPLGGTE